MKIGVYILDAMISGVTTFAFDLATGFYQAGHQATTITSTKSGKETVRWSRADGGARWWREAPDVTVAHTELASVLDTFDLVILSDLDASTLGDDRGFELGFRGTKTPWVVVAHGNSYDDKHAPSFRALIEDARHFTGIVLACPAPYSYDEHPQFKDLLCLPIKRPYVPKMSMCSTPPIDMHSAGTVGRFSTGKNLHLMAFSWLYTDVPLIEVHGAAINSIRPSDPYLTFEALAKRDDVTVLHEPASKNKTSEWMLSRRGRTEPILRYGGGYTDPLEKLRRLRVFVNLTSSTFSAGTEYTTMEAIDAGCLILAPDGLIDSGSLFSVGLLEPIDVPRGVVKGLQYEMLLREIAERTSNAVAIRESLRTELVHWNREVLRAEHSPVVIARGIIDRVTGK